LLCDIGMLDLAGLKIDGGLRHRKKEIPFGEERAGHADLNVWVFLIATKKSEKEATQRGYSEKFNWMLKLRGSTTGVPQRG